EIVNDSFEGLAMEVVDNFNESLIVEVVEDSFEGLGMEEVDDFYESVAVEVVEDSFEGLEIEEVDDSYEKCCSGSPSMEEVKDSTEGAYKANDSLYQASEGRPICPLQGHHMCAKKGKANWEELLAGMVGASVSWFPRWKEGGARVLCSCEGFPNIPLIGTRGCINYNPILAIRQLGYPMRGAPSEEIIALFVTRGFSEGNANMLQRIRKAWNIVERKYKELRGSSNSVIGGYHKWLKARTQGITWLSKLKSPSGEEAEVPEESEEVQALKAELERMRVAKEN
ncbi:hypothetical protein D0Y65_050745, partial [Glycine soja]